MLRTAVSTVSTRHESLEIRLAEAAADGTAPQQLFDLRARVPPRGRTHAVALVEVSERHTSSTSEAVDAVELADDREAALPKPEVGYTDL